MDAPLIFHEDGPVARIVFNRPEARNAVTFEMYEGLARACRSISRDGPVRVLVLSGAGPDAFAAGTDIPQLSRIASLEAALAYETLAESALTAIEDCPVPTIAALSGACTGGGAALAACCDLRIATRSLRFGVPIARTLGNCLTIRNHQRLTALIGASRAAQMLLLARLVTAEEALASGLIAEIVEDEEALEARIAALAEALLGHAPLTLWASKRAQRALEDPDAEAIDRERLAACYESADFREGVSAFLDKRRPAWTGR